MKLKMLFLAISLAFNVNASEKFAEERILVEPKAGVSIVEFENTLKNNKAEKLNKIGKTNYFKVKVLKGSEIFTINTLKNNPLIKNAELDKLVSPSSNDPLLSNQWHHTNIHSKEAWPISTGSNITIAICDSGVLSTHDDLKTNILPGFNTVDNTTDTTDINGHGTAVAGTAAATYNNAIGVSGVAGSAYILPVKITNDPAAWAYFSDMAECVTWAADSGARVVNISYNNIPQSSIISSAGSYLKSKKGILVVAAGNDNLDYGTLEDNNMIVVSATTSANIKTSWSNYGAYIDLSAPGVSILTTNKSSNTSYSYASGTSFASPITAGVAALLFSTNPGLTSSQAESIIKATATDLGEAGWDQYYGYGLVNAKAAVDSAFTVPSDREPPTINITSSSTGAVSNTITISCNTTDNIGVSKVELFINDSLYATDTGYPFTFAINTKNYINGTVLSINAKAFDESNNEGTSNIIVVEVQNIKKGRGKPRK